MLKTSASCKLKLRSRAKFRRRKNALLHILPFFLCIFLERNFTAYLLVGNIKL
jgi:hypothetical protein